MSQRPKSRVPVQEADAARLMRLIDALEESDDVSSVDANFDVEISSGLDAALGLFGPGKKLADDADSGYPAKFNSQPRRAQTERLDTMRPVELIEEMRQHDLWNAGARRRRRRAGAAVMNGRSHVRQDEIVRYRADDTHVVGVG